VEEISTGMAKAIAKEIKEFTLTVTGTKGFENAQVTKGGVDTSDINPETMESLLVPGLYFCGEIIDIDGLCGGFNLQWAFASGLLAGELG
jgi:predicted flavoprotein YhiN